MLGRGHTTPWRSLSSTPRACPGSAWARPVLLEIARRPAPGSCPRRRRTDSTPGAAQSSSEVRTRVTGADEGEQTRSFAPGAEALAGITRSRRRPGRRTRRLGNELGGRWSSRHVGYSAEPVARVRQCQSRVVTARTARTTVGSLPRQPYPPVSWLNRPATSERGRPRPRRQAARVRARGRGRPLVTDHLGGTAPTSCSPARPGPVPCCASRWIPAVPDCLGRKELTVSGLSSRRTALRKWSLSPRPHIQRGTASSEIASQAPLLRFNVETPFDGGLRPVANGGRCRGCCRPALGQDLVGFTAKPSAGSGRSRVPQRGRAPVLFLVDTHGV